MKKFIINFYVAMSTASIIKKKANLLIVQFTNKRMYTTLESIIISLSQ
ncbi:MAG TPA: hypothetical protein VF623_00760 [Segetibacter sp.]